MIRISSDETGDQGAWNDTQPVIMGSELWLFTMKFPFGHGEAFLETELPLVAAGFDRVLLFPLEGGGDKRPLPPNVEVQVLLPGEVQYQPLPIGSMLTRLPQFARVWRAVAQTAPSRDLMAANRRELLSILRQAFNRLKILRATMGHRYDPAKVVLYSYWTSDWATVLGCWRLMDPGIRFVTRMHGFDLFAERADGGWPMLQGFHVEQARRIFVASQAGLDDLLARYPERNAVFELARLGTSDHGPGPWIPGEALRVVSCSNLVELKRVPLIAEALRQVQGPVEWTHFGDGPERAAVEETVRTLPPNVQVNLMGSRPNQEVIAWYKTRSADVFVHASRTEGGAPVALQEAASFGIPLVGADAGGVREVVTDESGILLPLDLRPEYLGQVLQGFRKTVWYTSEARARVRAFWQGRFQAEAVYGELLRKLKVGNA